jgi:hypothetical protein
MIQLVGKPKGDENENNKPNPLMDENKLVLRDDHEEKVLNEVDKNLASLIGRHEQFKVKGNEIHEESKIEGERININSYIVGKENTMKEESKQEHGDIYPHVDLIRKQPEAKKQFKITGICLHDYDKLNIDDLLTYDKRSFWQYYIDWIMTNHIIFSMFRRSYLYPYLLKCFMFILSISLLFFFNTLLYSDNYIENKAILNVNERVNS